MLVEISRICYNIVKRMIRSVHDMGQIRFVKMEDELKKQGISWDVPPCCDPKVGNYSVLRAQIVVKFWLVLRVCGLRERSTTRSVMLY